VPLILVILLQKADLTVDKTLAGPYNLVVGLRCREDGACSANGRLYRYSKDSQIELTFTAYEKGLDIYGSCASCILQNVSVYGLGDNMAFCTIDSPNSGAKCTVKKESRVIEINDLQLDLSNSDSCTIKWNIGTEEPETEPPGTDVTEQTVTDVTETEQTVTDVTETEQTVTDVTETEQTVTDVTETEQTVTDVTETEQTVTDVTETEQTLTDVTETEQTVTYVTETEQTVTDVTETEQTVTDVTETEQTAN
jgi:hypothetical protein